MTPLHRIASFRLRNPRAVIMPVLWTLGGFMMWFATTVRDTVGDKNQTGSFLGASFLLAPALILSLVSLWKHEERVIAKRGPQTKQELHETIERLESELGMR